MVQKENKDTNRRVQEIMQDLGKIPPQAIELEEAILGAMIVEPSCIDVVQELIPSDAFYKDTHRVVCEAIFSLKKQSYPVDLLTVTEQLKKEGKLDIVGGPYFLAQLTSKVATSAHVEFHCKVVLEKYLAREIIRYSSDIQERASDNMYSIDDLLAESETGLKEIMQYLNRNIKRSLLDIISQSLDEIRFAKEHPDQAFGIPSPLEAVNRLTNGWQNSDLIILAGRPSRGKTAFALANIRTCCEAGKRALMFSLEMKDTQLMKRLIWSHGIDPDEAGGKISRWNLDVDQTGGIDASYIVNTCRSIKRIKGLDFVVVDYLQLMAMGKGENRNYQIGDIMAALKNLAKELDIPIMLLSQLNRDIEKRTSREPEMSDLRESGNIEQDADVVVFITRPWMDGILEDKDGNSTEYITVLKFSKHRNGKCGVKIKARNNEKVNFYEDWETYNSEFRYLGGSQPDAF